MLELIEWILKPHKIGSCSSIKYQLCKVRQVSLRFSFLMCMMDVFIITTFKLPFLHWSRLCTQNNSIKYNKVSHDRQKICISEKFFIVKSAKHPKF